MWTLFEDLIIFFIFFLFKEFLNEKVLKNFFQCHDTNLASLAWQLKCNDWISYPGYGQRKNMEAVAENYHGFFNL